MNIRFYDDGSLRPEYTTYRSMKARCTDTERKDFKYYGGRGIKICAPWSHSFESFLEAMGKRPSANYSIERRNNDKDYSPENCYWATQTAQVMNRGMFRNNKSGIKGVRFNAGKQRWITRCTIAYKEIQLYVGKDFFEACCARKSWENSHV